VTVFPKKPLEGAHEIQSFCLGHSEFITCTAFVSTPELTQGYLMSGSGDSTVRLWDITSGSLLDTCEVSTVVEISILITFICKFIFIYLVVYLFSVSDFCLCVFEGRTCRV
jgi:WD40 repeat protein